MGEHRKLADSLYGSDHAHYLEQMNDQEFWQYAEQLASVSSTTASPNDSYLECQLACGRCVLSLALLCEVVAPPHHLTLLPQTPLWMPGVLSWRGDVIATVDLDAYLTGQPASLHANQMLLVVQHNDIAIGFFVAGAEASLSLLTIIRTQIEPLDENTIDLEKFPQLAACVSGLYEGVFVFDLQYILHDVMRQIEGSVENG